MEPRQIYCAGCTKAVGYAAKYLSSLGLPITTEPNKSVGHVLLDVPSFGPTGLFRNGTDPEPLFNLLPQDIILYGGNLNFSAHRCVDFLKDEAYLAENAYITAECALDVALPFMGITLRRCPVLIIGWGRIGKCLASLLRSIGASVTVAARSETDRAILRALDYDTADPQALRDTLHHYRLIYNTVPAAVLKQEDMTRCRPDCVKIDLASVQGMYGEDVIIARGLPGLHMSESSGMLIAKTFIRYYKKGDIL